MTRGPELRGRYVIRITPDDVGQRVSVRARIGHDLDGPCFSDTLGVLEAWTDGLLHIRRRGGSVAQVPESTMVAGKTLPPRPDITRRHT